jgi:hypothetical protein
MPRAARAINHNSLVACTDAQCSLDNNHRATPWTQLKTETLITEVNDNLKIFLIFCVLQICATIFINLANELIKLYKKASTAWFVKENFKK